MVKHAGQMVVDGVECCGECMDVCGDAHGVFPPFPLIYSPALLSPTLPAHTFERKGDIQTLIQKLITLELRPILP